VCDGGQDVSYCSVFVHLGDEKEKTFEAQGKGTHGSLTVLMVIFKI